MRVRRAALLWGLAAAVVVLHGALLSRLVDGVRQAGAPGPRSTAEAVVVVPLSLLIVSRALGEADAGAGPVVVEPSSTPTFEPVRQPIRAGESIVAPARSPPPARRQAMPPVDAAEPSPAMAQMLRTNFTMAAAPSLDERPSSTSSTPAAAPDQPAEMRAEMLDEAEPADAASRLASPPELMAAATTPVATLPAAAAREEDAEPLPTYRTRIPKAALVNYRLSRSGLVGSGELDWRPDAGGYTLKLEGKLPLVGTLITQTSRGRFDAAGLAPERYTDKRIKRGEQAASFQRSAGLISFSGQSPDVPVTPGVQDRLSVMVQLAAIAAGWSKTPPVGEHFLIRVVGARGDAHRWSLRFEGPQSLTTPEGPVAALRFLREPENLQDTRAEFWLDPARQYLPVRVRIADGNGDALELMRVP